MAISKNYTTYLSRPDLVAPILDVTVHIPALLQTGYWLYAPHYESNAESLLDSSLQPGPYIFDTNGELAWSGTHLLDWTFFNDFKYHEWGEFSLLEGGTLRTSSPKGATPMVLDSSLQTISTINMPDRVGQVNPHELQLANYGSTIVVEKAMAGPVTDNAIFQTVEDHVFEIDRNTSDVIFSWNSSEHIPTPKPKLVDLEGFAQTLEVHFLRLNSVDRTDSGDYLLSGRGTNTIYLVSGTDGNIIWRLGGKDAPMSDFKLQNFTFSAQHDARMLHLNRTGISLISFLDNASDGYETSANTSAGMVVALNHRNKTASLVSRLERPDGRISDRRGNVQALPDERFQVCWSQYGWVTEFDAAGKNIVEARFRDGNLYTYRAYKVLSEAFKGMISAELPVIAAFKVQNGMNSRSGNAVLVSTYVSWNGGFGVTSWKIYGCSTRSDMDMTNDNQAPPDCNGRWSLLTEGRKQGFESKLEQTTKLNVALVYAEALDDTGNVMAQSEPSIVKTMESDGGDATSPIEQQSVNSMDSADGSEPSTVQSATSPITDVWSVHKQDTEWQNHGLNVVVSWTPVSGSVRWITRFLLMSCMLSATISVICAIRCLRSGRVQL